MKFSEWLNENNDSKTSDDKLIKKYEDKLKAVQKSYKDDKDEAYILWSKSELKAVKNGGIEELKKFWKEHNIDGNTNDDIKKLKKYLNESNLNEAKINTFKMGDWKDRKSIENIPSKIKGKITIDIDAKLKNAHKNIYENGEVNQIEIEYDRKSLEKQIKEQIDKLLAKELKVKSDELDSGGSSDLIGFINQVNYL